MQNKQTQNPAINNLKISLDCIIALKKEKANFEAVDILQKNGFKVNEYHNSSLSSAISTYIYNQIMPSNSGEVPDTVEEAINNLITIYNKHSSENYILPQ